MNSTKIKQNAYAVLLPWIVWRLRRLTRKIERDKQCTAEDWVNLVRSFSVRTFHIAPLQISSEIVSLCERVQDLRPRNVLEIGTARGGTLYLWCRMARRNAKIASIDLPGGRFGGGYPKWKEYLYRSFAGPEQKIHLFRGSSHSPRVTAAVETSFDRAPFDFLFLDGDHTVEGVRRDFDLYAPRVRPGGLIALHDIVPGPQDRVGGVPDFWREIQQERNTEELVENWGQGGYGIGLIWV